MSTPKSLQRHWQTGLLIVNMFVGACTAPEVVVAPSPSSLPISTQIINTSTPVRLQTPRPTLTSIITPTTYVITSTGSTPQTGIPPICLSTSAYLASEDGVWIGADCKLYRELIITNQSTGQEITIPYVKLNDEGSNYFSIRPLHWSSNNRYFYFTTSCCEPYETSNRNGSLYRFDTQKESWDVFIRAVYDPYYFFSESGDRLVYVNHYPFENTISVVQYIEIGMLEISSNESKRVVLTGYYIPAQPSYTWSKDNNEFTITLNHPITREMRTEEVMLKIDFKKMDMWLVK